MPPQCPICRKFADLVHNKYGSFCEPCMNQVLQTAKGKDAMSKKNKKEPEPNEILVDEIELPNNEPKPEAQQSLPAIEKIVVTEGQPTFQPVFQATEPKKETRGRKPKSENQPIDLHPEFLDLANTINFLLLNVARFVVPMVKKDFSLNLENATKEKLILLDRQLSAVLAEQLEESANSLTLYLVSFAGVLTQTIEKNSTALTVVK